MKNSETSKKNSEKVKPSSSNNHTGTDKDADHTGVDSDNDKTEIAVVPTGKDSLGEDDNKFDKPKRETDPDTTGIDTNADKTKK